MAAGAEPAIVLDPTQALTEKTEPFSQSELEARLQNIQVQRASFKPGNVGSVRLDELVVPPGKDIRTLFLPFWNPSVSAGHPDNCEWLALRAEVQSPEGPDTQHRVLAVTQTSKDIKFSVWIPGGSSHRSDLEAEMPASTLWCELYFDPASDNQILKNKSDVPISLSRVSQLPPSSPGTEHTVNPDSAKALPPGTWRIKLEGVEVLDFRILEKRPATLHLPSLTPSESSSSLGETINSSGKRGLEADDDTPQGPKARRIRGPDDSPRKQDGVIEFLPHKAEKLVFPLPVASNSKEIVAFNGHPLLDMQRGDTVDVPGGCELDTYRLTKMDHIASTSLSSVFKGVVEDHPNIPTHKVITVKVLKTCPPSDQARPLDNERTVIRQADVWLREYQESEALKHENIPKFYGGDARYLSLYMEHVPAHNLTTRGTWRGLNNDFFVGTKQDARRIMFDISRALNYMHGRQRAHNDIKPGNIMYSPERGAVLCDFGMAAPARNAATTGGTPWYVPPEFLGHKMRGHPGDVWALGVTMLYVLQKLPLPESRQQWLIAELNKPPARGGGQLVPFQGGGRAGATGQPTAVAQMMRWLDEVNKAKELLNPADRVEFLVAKMLVPHPAGRITMKAVVNELYGEQQQLQARVQRALTE